MTSELFSVFACNSSGGDFITCSNPESSGAMYLTSTLWSGNVRSIRIPKGCAFKVWESKVQSNTAASKVHTQVSMSGTGVVYNTFETDTVGSSGSEQRTSRSGRPLVVESHDGERAVRFLCLTNTTKTSGVVVASYNCEIVELNAD